MFVLVIVALGAILVVGSHASTPYAANNADKGTLSGSAAVRADSTASDGSKVVFGDSTTSSATINANPDGPPTPAGGWSVVFGDAFNVPFSQDSLWSAGTEGPLNSNELECFDPGQVNTGSGGLNITMQYASGACHYNSNTQNLLSGEAETKNFWWENNQPGSFVFETYTRFPINTGETDLGFWGDGPPWGTSETDYFETGGWGSPNTQTTNWTQSYLFMAMVGAGVNGDDFSPFKNYDPSGGLHRYTILVQANKMSMWIDGDPVPSLQNLGPGNPSTSQLPIWLTYGARTCSSCVSGFTSGSRQWTTRSVAVYRDTANVGVGYKNGGLAPGTAVK